MSVAQRIYRLCILFQQKHEPRVPSKSAGGRGWAEKAKKNKAISLVFKYRVILIRYRGSDKRA
jgi:hypothetical protein